MTFIGSFPVHRIGPEVPPIFLVTSVSPKPGRSSRCWGWFPSKEQAVASVLHNEGDMFEAGSYPFVIIETCRAGILGLIATRDDEVWWFEWTEGAGVQHGLTAYDGGGYAPLSEPPAWSSGVICYGMG